LKADNGEGHQGEQFHKGSREAHGWEGVEAVKLRGNLLADEWEY
jgi:hypothetical protein